MLTIKEHVKVIREYVKFGNVDAALKQHEQLSAVAKSPAERMIVHDMGNELQKVVFEHYTKGH